MFSRITGQMRGAEKGCAVYTSLGGIALTDTHQQNQRVGAQFLPFVRDPALMPRAEAAPYRAAASPSPTRTAGSAPSPNRAAPCCAKCDARRASRRVDRSSSRSPFARRPAVRFRHEIRKDDGGAHGMNRERRPGHAMQGGPQGRPCESLQSIIRRHASPPSKTRPADQAHWRCPAPAE